ncbi:uncharacterized protein ARMOST_17378 [Armillaria ostoyae]|uniref:Uncharacterized protein n=1 Tax=Armillaria ostoyae TaxID=47428 RepID=A0A284RYW1_ARMOS|nr:uncharacterized protein ARMOST_17378 [Armillaria ostoyae]
MPGIDYRRFLVWKGSQEEVVLNVQGVVVEAYLPPLLHSKNPKCEKTFQMVKISAPTTDKQFSQAYQAISNIYGYMSRHEEHITTLERSVTCNMPAIHADCKLMNAWSHNCDEILESPSIVDPDGLMKDTIDRGDFVYTEDNAIQFYEWRSEDKHRVDTKTIHPCTVRAGDIVDMSVSFRLINVNSGVRFQVKLDTLTVISHSGSEPYRHLQKHDGFAPHHKNPDSKQSSVSSHTLSVPMVNVPPLDTSNVTLTGLGISIVCSRLQMEAKAELAIDLRMGRLYSAMAFNLAYTFVPCYKPNTRRRNVRDFHMEMYVRDSYRPIYVSGTMGYYTIMLKERPGMVLHFFYCPLQLIVGVHKHNNKKNATLSSYLPMNTSWYGNFLIMVTEGNKTVDFEQTASFTDMVDDVVKKFVIDYIADWEVMKVFH